VTLTLSFPIKHKSGRIREDFYGISFLLRAKSIILPLVENEINIKLFPFEDKNTVVEVSDLGEYNAVIGAATFLLEEFYDIPEPFP